MTPTIWQGIKFNSNEVALHPHCFTKIKLNLTSILYLKVLILSFIFGLLFCACSVSKETFSSSKAVFVTLNSPQAKFADAGFLYQNKTNTKLEIYNLAQPLFTLDIRQSKICLNGYCTSKLNFNQKFFQNAHYDEFISDIISGKALYAGLNFEKKPCGFEQILISKSGKFNINYKVCNGEISFEDSIKKIKFSLKRIKDD